MNPLRDINRQVARRAPPDVAWMREYLDTYLDERGWPAVVSSSEVEDSVLSAYPYWQTRQRRLREIITRALHGAGYVRRSRYGRGWSREAIQTDPLRSSGEGKLIKIE